MLCGDVLEPSVPRIQTHCETGSFSVYYVCRKVSLSPPAPVSCSFLLSQNQQLWFPFPPSSGSLQSAPSYLHWMDSGVYLISEEYSFHVLLKSILLWNFHQGDLLYFISEQLSFYFRWRSIISFSFTKTLWILLLWRSFHLRLCPEIETHLFWNFAPWESSHHPSSFSVLPAKLKY